MTNTEATQAVDWAISELRTTEFAEAEKGANPPSKYLHSHRHEYIRTVSDILEYRPPSDKVKVLEIGAFFGVVCMALKHLGYDVTASDMPEYMEADEQIERYARRGIERASFRLEEFLLPFSTETFDVIIMCEVLEHLNFNPLPLLKEVNRIGKPKSIFYIALPNGANIYNRKAALLGKGIGIKIERHFQQLEKDSPFVVYDHWREYTGPEVREMLERVGYRIAKQYYFSLGETLEPKSLKKKLARTFYHVFPAFKENQTTIAVRERRTDLEFHIPETVHKTLRSI